MNDVNDQTRRLSYFKLRKVGNNPPLDKNSLPVVYLKNRLPKNKNADIIDIGCGYGHLMQLVKNAGYSNVYGIDIEKESLNYCRKNNLNVEEIVTVQDYAKTTSKKFDFAIMTHVIEHIKKEKVIETLAAVKSLLKKDGVLYIATPNAHSRSGCYWAYEDFTHEHIFTAGSFYYVLKAAGFENVEFVDPDGLENSRFIFLKKLLLNVYKLNATFWDKVTGAAYHPESPKIYNWELKATAS